MRLFAAVELSEKNKAALENAARELARFSAGGSFTKKENFHITLCFIGETDKLAEAKEAVASFSATPFDAGIRGTGVFRRDDGDIVWAGIEKCEALERAAAYLAGKLREKGFKIEKRGFTAHITLARRFRPRQDFDFKAFSAAFPVLKQHVDKISLMSSELKDGRRKYEAVYVKKLI
ncbi:MAG: RNA 2',3'-cyclic phosphodiesterase [Oscillospiraceae bacterium]|nr:RNA 2',3'-cyclic phosphodiesterase [Oscillospiraceae bacterium]